jgi:integrase
MLLGKRAEELYGLRWNQPPTEKEKKNCSGWLLPNWEREKYLFLHDTKNRKPERVFLDQRSIVLLQRLQRSRHTEANKWAVKSPFLFPQRKKPELAATSSSFRKQLIDLNNKLDLEIKFQIKISRKTFGSMIADKYGIERAARKLNHSSTKVTKEHYIVPEDRDLEIEDVYQSNVERLKKAE